MKATKTIILIFTLAIFNTAFAQESNKVEKIKIGKFKYETYFRYFYHYEVKEQGYALCYKRNGREQSICASLYFNDSNVLSISDITLDKKKLVITCLIKNLIKRGEFEADSTKYVKKQNKSGLFETTTIIEYKDGKETVLFKK